MVFLLLLLLLLLPFFFFEYGGHVAHGPAKPEEVCEGNLLEAILLLVRIFFFCPACLTDGVMLFGVVLILKPEVGEKFPAKGAIFTFFFRVLVRHHIGLLLVDP